MARHGRDGGQAARAGATDSVLKARRLDREYFERNPRARSYIRPYLKGEALAISDSDPQPLKVAVAFVSLKTFCRAAIFDLADQEGAKQVAEEMAAQQRGGNGARGASA